MFKRGERVANTIFAGRAVARARGLEAWVSRIKDENVNNSSLSIESRKAIGTGVMATKTGASIDSLLARVELKSFFGLEKSVAAKRCRL